jgi:uncharacterized phage protein (TIGR02218 family)
MGYAQCKKALGPLTVTGAITHVTDGRRFRDSSRSEAADWFGAGTIAFTSGQNAGLKPLEIKSYAADGTITVFEAFPYLPEVGDTFVLIPGCRRRLQDCRDKWQNVAVTNGVHALKQYPNKGGFFGFTQMPTQSAYSEIGGTR